MKVIQYSEYGLAHDVCECIEVEEPGAPGRGEILISVEASAINPADLLIIEGRYPGPGTLPARQGIEGAGSVLDVGEGVEGLGRGDRVLLLARDNWAERVRMPAEQAVKIPHELDVLQAAQMKANPPSAKLMLTDFKNMNPGDWIIQNAANSAVGLHVIRYAKQMGIKTVNVVRRESLIETLSAIGADLVIVDGDDLAERVRAEIGGGNMPLAIDAIGGSASMRLADCLTDGGLVINYGFLSGEPCMITPTQAIVRQISLTGFWLVTRLFQKSRDVIETTYAEIAELFLSGVLNSPVEATYTLEQAKEALAHAHREGRNGKIVFTPNGPVK